MLSPKGAKTIASSKRERHRVTTNTINRTGSKSYTLTKKYNNLLCMFIFLYTPEYAGRSGGSNSSDSVKKRDTSEYRLLGQKDFLSFICCAPQYI